MKHERLTKPGADLKYSAREDDINQAIQKLAIFENMCDALVRENSDIPAELEALRLGGKDKTVKFKEAMARKLINGSVVAYLERFGIKLR